MVLTEIDYISYVTNFISKSYLTENKRIFKINVTVDQNTIIKYVSYSLIDR